MTPCVEGTLGPSSPWHFLGTAGHKGLWEIRSAAWPVHSLLTKPTVLLSLGCLVHAAGMDGEAAVSG